MGFEPMASRATIWRANQLRYIHHMPYTMTKAGDGNRTHVFSLEGWCSTIEPHLQNQVSLKGFEPPTLGLEGRCSIQLSYRLIYFVFRKQIGVTGFEPATPWSQTRYSSQTEPHPVDSFTQSRLSDTYSIIPKHYCNVKHFLKNFKKVLSQKNNPGKALF